MKAGVIPASSSGSGTASIARSSSSRAALWGLRTLRTTALANPIVAMRGPKLSLTSTPNSRTKRPRLSAIRSNLELSRGSEGAGSVLVSSFVFMCWLWFGANNTPWV
jgi:hypothetical protein